MNAFDVIGGVQLTAYAAIVVTALSFIGGRDIATRIKIAATLAAWFVVVVILAATRMLHDGNGLGAPGMGVAVFVPIIALWLAVTRVRSLRDAMDQAPLWLLVAVHVGRVLGVNFLLLQAAGRLPAPFAPSAGWGDIIAGVAAVPVAWAVHRQVRGWRTALLAWNVFGMLDLITAVSLGVLSSPGPLRRIFAEPGSGEMSTLPWLLIPGYLVPLLFVTHLAILRRLGRTTAASPRGTDGGSVRLAH